MAKVQIKETMSKTVSCKLNMDVDEILLEVEGFDEPLSFKDTFARFNGELVNIKIDLKIDHTPDNE